MCLMCACHVWFQNMVFHYKSYLKGGFFFRRICTEKGPFLYKFKIQFSDQRAQYSLNIEYSEGYGLETCYVHGCLTI